MKLRFFAISGLFAAFLASTAAAQDFVVAASTAEGVGPGRMLAADAPLTLKAGEAVTLIGPAGPVEVAGPFDGTAGAAAGAPAASEGSALAALVARRDRMTKLGAFRSGDEERDATTLFDLFADAAWCVEGEARPILFVAPRKTDRVIELAEAGGARAEVFWPAGEATRPWPDEAPFRPGLRYAASVGGVALGDFELKPGPGGTGAARIEGLIEAGCLSQAEHAFEGR